MWSKILPRPGIEPQSTSSQSVALTIRLQQPLLTCQFYGACFYGSAAWLHRNNPYKDIIGLNAVYYHLSRIARKDFEYKLSISKLDEMGRTRPMMWTRYQSTSIAFKSPTRKLPERLYNELSDNSYFERRKPKRMKYPQQGQLEDWKEILTQQVWSGCQRC